jgi:hypothetical protein
MDSLRKPRIIDGFSCAGGAGWGYHLAGYEVVGVDVASQPNYPFEFVQGDAIEFIKEHGHEFDAIHASPPCQHAARVTAWRGSRDNHPNLIPATREALLASGLPWVMENVPEADLRVDLLLCGSQFDLKVRRHRVFEASFPLTPHSAPHRHEGLLPFMHKGERAYADAMGCTWMSSKEGRQAIPPAYTEFIGLQLLGAV